MSPVTPEKEDLNIFYKSSTFTDGDEKRQKLDLHMSIMYHPNSKEPTKISLFIPRWRVHELWHKFINDDSKTKFTKI